MNAKEWRDIKKDNCMSEATLHRLHSKALLEFSKIIKKPLE